MSAISGIRWYESKNVWAINPPPYNEWNSLRGSQGEIEMATPNVLEFTEANWETEVVNSPIPVLVDFWAPWCGPCRQLTPIIDKIADQFAGKVKVGKVNVDENQELGSQYNIATIPRMLIFKGSNKPVQQLVGLTSEANLSKLLNEVV